MFASILLLKSPKLPRADTRTSLPMAFIKESTASRSQLKKQLSTILTAAKSNGYKLEEIMSEDMKDQFEGMVELKAARTYIKEADAREKELLAANDKLTAELEEKQQELDCQPGELHYLQIDVKQLNHQIEYYKKMADDAQGRAGRYQARLREAVDKQKYDDGTATKIKRLEAVIQTHHAQIIELLDENRAAAILYEDMHVSHKQALAMKDDEIAHLIAKMEKIEVDKEAMDEITEACSSLIDTLEAETNLTAIQLNHHSLAMQRNEKLVSAAVSELLPLNRFYDRAFAILHIYQVVFQRLADPRAMSIATLPTRELDMLFRAATEDMYQYREVHRLMQIEGLAQDAMRLQVEMLADHAMRLHGSLSAMQDDTVGFLNRISREPSVWRALKARFA